MTRTQNSRAVPLPMVRFFSQYRRRIVIHKNWEVVERTATSLLTVAMI